MNLYLRYFDSEILVTNAESAIDFLDSIPEIGMNDKIADDVRAYFESDNKFPKRYKVRPKIYFIMIKTIANTMAEFKEYRQNSVDRANHDAEPMTEGPFTEVSDNGSAEASYVSPRERGAYQIMALQSPRFGWYEGVYDFKRVVTNPVTGKNEYRDTHFVVRCKAMSGMDCYNRIIDHLRERVDGRSQFPSAKGKNFSFTYLGDCKPDVANNE